MMKYLGYTIKFQSEYDQLDRVIAETQEVGCNFYTVVPSFHVEFDNSPSIYPGHKGPLLHPDKAPEILEALRQKGVEHIMLKPQVHPNDARGKTPDWWSGYVSMDNPRDKNEFFGNYFNIIFKNIRLAGQFNAKHFCIGTELASMLQYQSNWSYWIQLIRRWSEIKLVYSANFWQPLRSKYYWLIRFYTWFFGYKKALDYLLLGSKWNIPDKFKGRVGRDLMRSYQGHNRQLDYLGFGAYYWYTFDKPYSEDEIRERWHSVEARLPSGWKFNIRYVKAVERWQRYYGRYNPLFITEADVVETPHRQDFDFYRRWWKVFFEVWKDRAELIQAWEDGNFGMWVRAMKEIDAKQYLDD